MRSLMLADSLVTLMEQDPPPRDAADGLREALAAIPWEGPAEREAARSLLARLERLAAGGRPWGRN